MDLPADNPSFFETEFEVNVLIRQAQPTQPVAEWQEFDQGPGKFTIPQGYQAGVRARNIDDDDLEKLVADLVACKVVTFLNLAENRKITERGIARLALLDWLTHLNLSSCSLNNGVLETLLPLKKLEYLNLSYCNRLTDDALRPLKKYPRLVYLDIQGCPKITHAGIRRYQKRGLTIHPKTG